MLKNLKREECRGGDGGERERAEKEDKISLRCTHLSYYMVLAKKKEKKPLEMGYCNTLRRESTKKKWTRYTYIYIYVYIYIKNLYIYI